MYRTRLWVILISFADLRNYASRRDKEAKNQTAKRRIAITIVSHTANGKTRCGTFDVSHQRV